MLVIFNPTAGRRRAGLLWRVLDVLTSHGVRLKVARTMAPGDAERMAREAAHERVRLVVVAGGDGTIAEVANGLIGSDTRLGVIPLGTANVLAHEFSLPFSPGAIASALAADWTTQLWPGIASGNQGSRAFLQMLGAGFDAQVVHRLPPTLKRALGRQAYVMQVLREAVRFSCPSARLLVDGVETQAASVVVSKGRLYGGPYLLAPGADPRRPGFSLVLFDEKGLVNRLCYGAALPLGVLARMPGVRQVRARQVCFIGNDRIPVQSDGDAAGFTPLAINDAPAPIKLIVDRNSAKAE